MNQHAGQFDHSSDPAFLEYYSRSSLSDETRGRFTRVRDVALALLIERGTPAQSIDVLDIGCGAGTQAMLWAELGHRVRALDVNGPLIDVAKGRAEQAGLSVDFEVGTATALPFATSSADVVLMPELLEHVTEWQACLTEAIRVLRPGGLLYLSTSNWLCPRQQEFNLPWYPWYPSAIKRWCERKSLTSHPQWANHARYPAVNWFSYYELRAWLAGRGLKSLDRFDVLSRKPLPAPSRMLVRLIRGVPAARFMAHVATEGTTVWAFKESAA